MNIRRLTEEDAESYRQLRFEALKLEPQAFTESPAEHQDIELEQIGHRLGLGVSDGNFILGGFDDGRLVGMVGFFRRQGEKFAIVERSGVYTSTGATDERLGPSLDGRMIMQLRSLPGLEQVALGISTGNVVAKRLYESLGFEIYGREARALKFGNEYVDEELMILYLRR